MRVMALDVGDRRIGVAVSDAEGILATPLTVVHRRGKRVDAWAIVTLAREQEAERIVIGLPRSLDSTLGPQAEKVQEFGHEIAKRSPLPIEYWDERFSTVEAEQRMLEAGIAPEDRRRRIDQVAAAIILEDYLASQRK